MMIFPAKFVDSAGTDMWVLIYRTIITFLSAQSVTQTKDSGGHKTKDDTLACHQLRIPTVHEETIAAWYETVEDVNPRKTNNTYCSHK